MTSDNSSLANSYTSAATATKAMSAAVTTMAATTVSAADLTVKSAARTAAAIGISLPSVPTSQIYATSTGSTARTAAVDSKGNIIAPIYIQAQSPELIGQQVTQMIKNATGQ